MNEPTHRLPEPEIIPPGVPLPRGSGLWVSLGREPRYTPRLSPVSLVLTGLAVGIGLALGIVLLLGFLAISLVSVGLLAIGFVIAGILRKANRPLR